MAWKHDSPSYETSSVYYAGSVSGSTQKHQTEKSSRATYCTQCGGELNKEYNYCPNCGAAVSREKNANQCGCGAYFAPEDKHCSSCGKAKSSESKAAK